jgi:tetratricopeptide (TPR) repeat protein
MPDFEAKFQIDLQNEVSPQNDKSKIEFPLQDERPDGQTVSKVYPVELIDQAIDDFDSDTIGKSISDTEKAELVDSLMRSALMLIDNGDTKSAMHLLRELLCFSPKDIEAIRWTGYCFKEQGDMVNAEKCYGQLCQIDPAHENLVELGEVQMLLGADVEAHKTYVEALSKVDQESPHLFTIYKNLGNIYVRVGDFESAEEQYNRAYVLRPHSDALLVNYGTLEIQKGNLDLGQQRFKDAIKINQYNDKAWVGLALVHRSKADINLAWGNLEHALDLNPLNLIALQIAFDWTLADQRYDTGIKLYKKFLSIKSDDAVHTIKLAQLLANAGRTIEASIETKNAEILNEMMAAGESL